MFELKRLVNIFRRNDDNGSLRHITQFHQLTVIIVPYNPKK